MIKIENDVFRGTNLSRPRSQYLAKPISVPAYRRQEAVFLRQRRINSAEERGYISPKTYFNRGTSFYFAEGISSLFKIALWGRYF
ncbi:hypothetical protein SAMN05444394_1997 [Algoriphagus halophilus]|uniref:Uncharacterized protein n=1 Tax=Algoriphagus halophilus TaxID=226505 RepID=A0A1N6ED27_9BACT|nr:hypothetical protein SAMN05444394_1997 [Algoriphagus halophilus]